MKVISKNLYIIIGILLIFHWIVLLIDRINYNILYNLFWISHIALLLAAIGFVLRSNLLLSGSLISILVGHSIWIYDTLVFIITKNSPFGYSSYLFGLGFFRGMVSSHHIYLIPLLLIVLWRQKKVSIHGWLIASVVFAFATISSKVFFPEYNVNCASFPCPFAAYTFLEALSPLTYFIIINLGMDLFAFLLPNLLLYWLFSKIKRKV